MTEKQVMLWLEEVLVKRENVRMKRPCPLHWGDDKAVSQCGGNMNDDKLRRDAIMALPVRRSPSER